MARCTVMKELREARKVNKQGKHLQAEKIKAELEAAMGQCILDTILKWSC